MQVELTIWPGMKVDVDPSELPQLRALGILVEKDKPADKEKEGK
jgi:hypothetical protein